MAQSFLESHWKTNLEKVKEILIVPFLQQMQSGDLQGDFYYQFIIQYVYSLGKVTDMLKEMATKKLPEDVHLMMVERHQFYKTFKEGVLLRFHLSDISGIEPIQTTESLLSEFNSFKNEKYAIYFAVVLYFHELIWIWLAKNVVDKEGNPYFNWKKNIPSPPEKCLMNLILDHLKTEEQILKVLEILIQLIGKELNFLASFP